MTEHIFRTRFTPDQRAAPLLPYLDPGLVNPRRVQMLLGSTGMQVVDDAIRGLPPDLPGWQREVRIDHIYTEAVLIACREAPSLAAVVANPLPQLGTIVASTEILEGSRDVYERERLRLRWRPELELPKAVYFDLSTRHIRADTLRSWLAETRLISFVAILDEVADDRLVFGPLVMGGPWLRHPPNGIDFETMFLHWDFFEHFVEDIDEFRRVVDVPGDVDWSQMKGISERAFKSCLCELLGDQSRKDWGGERGDHFTSHIHLRGRRLTAAFLLKGPGSGFKQMEMVHLGKNGDQIFRLASEPAEMLVVQHCHEIGTAVRATLRAFAVQPNRARRYCLIDGRDSFRLLVAYGLVEKALAVSQN
jgi:hypothetical protein